MWGYLIFTKRKDKDKGGAIAEEYIIRVNKKEKTFQIQSKSV